MAPLPDGWPYRAGRRNEHVTRSIEPIETTVNARGHANVSATHASTLEVTAENFLTPAGDCILGVEADATPADFPQSFREASRSHEAELTLALEAEEEGSEANHTETISGRGHPDLTFESDTSLVVRTSEYTDGRTVMVDAGKAAADLDRDLVAALAAGADLRLCLRVA
jgi:hypothetical protein